LSAVLTAARVGRRNAPTDTLRRHMRSAPQGSPIKAVAKTSRLGRPFASAPRSPEQRRLALGGIATIVGGVGAYEAISRISPDAMRVTAVFLALAGLVLTFRASRWLLAALGVVCSWLVAVFLIRYLPGLINPVPPVAQAVGAAAFADTPYRGPQLAAVLAVGTPFLVALLEVLLRRPRPRVPMATVEPPGKWRVGLPLAGAVPRGALAVWIGWAVLAFTLVPDIHAYMQGAGAPIPYSWDTSTVTSWQGFAQMGLVPMRDFFYPYGFQWLYTKGNFGPVFQWLVEAAMLGVAAWSLWRLSGRRAWRVLTCLVIVVLLGPWTEVWRYLPALLVPVGYAALGPARHLRPVKEHAFFFAVCLLALLIEPDLLVTGLVGAVMVLLGEIIAGRTAGNLRQLASGLVLDAMPVLASVVTIIFVWTATDTLQGNLRFYLGFTAVSAGSGSNEQLQGPLGQMVVHPNAYSLYAAAPALLAALGLLRARLSSEDGMNTAAILLSAAGVAFVLLLKHFVRAIGDEVLIPVLVALCWASILAWSPSSVVRAAACAAGLVAVITLTDQSGGQSPSQYLRSAVNAPLRAVHSIQAAFDFAGRVRAANERFASSRFAGWPDEYVADDYNTAVRDSRPPDFAIVGDSQMTYVLLGQAPPYMNDLYDASPISEQHIMLKVLRRRSPRFVIWRRDFCQDGLPYQVRDPLIFDWMIKNYGPVQFFPSGLTSNAEACSSSNATGAVTVLTRLRSRQPAAVAFWRSQMTTGEDLGYIPSLSDALGSSRCQSGPGCVRYAVVHAERPVQKGKVVAFRVGGARGSYTVTLRIRDGVMDYPVRIDRLWFWPFVGSRPRLSSLTPGYALHLVGLRSGDNLY